MSWGHGEASVVYLFTIHKNRCSYNIVQDLIKHRLNGQLMGLHFNCGQSQGYICHFMDNNHETLTHVVKLTGFITLLQAQIIQLYSCVLVTVFLFLGTILWDVCLITSSAFHRWSRSPRIPYPQSSATSTASAQTILTCQTAYRCDQSPRWPSAWTPHHQLWQTATASQVSVTAHFDTVLMLVGIKTGKRKRSLWKSLHKTVSSL